GCNADSGWWLPVFCLDPLRTSVNTLGSPRSALLREGLPSSGRTSSVLISNALLLIFAVAFMGCVLATPVVTRIALWSGAIGRPDQFRRIHKGATPRLGGLGLAFGLLVGVVLISLGGYLDSWTGFADWWSRQFAVLGAALVVLLIGFVDDTRALGPRIKLLGQ